MSLEPALEFVHVGMKFGTFTALEDVNLTLAPHRFHVLLGENGAGKSTLVKCLIGYQKPTSGGLVVHGKEVEFSSPREAFTAGLGMVYQHFTLADNLSVLENILLSRRDLDFFISLESQAQRFEKWMSQMPFQLPLKIPVGTLSAGEKQKLEILIQLYHNPSLLILDEPSSVLTPSEAEEVLGLLKAKVQAQEITVLLITHKFREVMRYGDTVTVLRRGRMVGHGPVSQFDVHTLGNLMVGDQNLQPEKNHEALPSINHHQHKGIEVSGLSVQGSRGIPALQDISFSVCRGEIYGLAGVSGNGQRELLEVFMGLHPEARRYVRLNGEAFRSERRYLKQNGVSVLPELPLLNACVKDLSVWENLMLHAPVYRPKVLKSQAEVLRQAFGIRTANMSAPIRTLSGGNIQRAVLARELRPDTKVFVVANPCFGLDFQATAEIRARILATRDQGAAVLLISEDLDEILELADNIGVLSEGRLVAEVSSKNVDVAALGRAMAGHGGSHERQG